MTDMNLDEIIRADIRSSLSKSGTMLFLAGFLIFMGIISSEIFYRPAYNTRDSYISELATVPAGEQAVQKPSATIFNYTMIATGILVLLSAFYVQKVFKKYLSTVPLALFGAGLAGVGFFPGYVAPWHFIFALIIFIFGGVAAITSFKIVHSPLRFIFILLGVIALAFLFFFKFFSRYLGSGGAERWLFYPIVFWLTGMGTYLLGIKDGHRNTLPVN
jgi:hypothetical membrane protein